MDFKEGVGAMIEKYFNGVIEQVYHKHLKSVPDH